MNLVDIISNDAIWKFNPYRKMKVRFKKLEFISLQFYIPLSIRSGIIKVNMIEHSNENQYKLIKYAHFKIRNLLVNKGYLPHLQTFACPMQTE